MRQACAAIPAWWRWGAGRLIDMAGYAAATAHRGVHLMRIPTTVMAQADASIGVKNGVNAFDKKEFYRDLRPAPGRDQ